MTVDNPADLANGLVADSYEEGRDGDVIRRYHVACDHQLEALVAEHADIVKAAKLFKRMAKAWLWNDSHFLAACMRALERDQWDQGCADDLGRVCISCGEG